MDDKADGVALLVAVLILNCADLYGKLMTHSFAGHFVMTWVTRVIIVTSVAKAWRRFRQPVESVQPVQRTRLWLCGGYEALCCAGCLPAAAGTPLNTVYVMSVRVPQVAL